MQLTLDMYQTMLLGIAGLLVGDWANRRVPILNKVCIPAPVTGGIIFSLLTLALHAWAGFDFSFDGTLKDVCMTLFFTSVGFQSNLLVLKRGGRPLVVMVVLVAVLIVIQNLTSVGIAAAMGLDPLLGMAAGSIPMCGGHGTAGGFSSMLEELGLNGAATITMAAATFGLLAGSLLGGPLAGRLIARRSLDSRGDDESGEVQEAFGELSVVEGESDEQSFRGYFRAACALGIAAGLGSLLNKALALTGISFPTYFGALLCAALIRNCTELIPGCKHLDVNEITSIGTICLSLFLGMAMVTLRLWELAGLALPLLVMLLCQVLVIWLFARFAAFPLLGRDYDAALLVGGLCGFGLGATPNAMANMSAVCGRYRYSPMPFLIVPIVGAMFVDIINISIITLFLNLLG